MKPAPTVIRVPRGGRSLLNSGPVNPLAAQQAERLLDAGVAGTCTSHGAENNLYKIGLLLEHDEANTFVMEDLLTAVGFEEAYHAVTQQIGNPPDREENPGHGCIDPARTDDQVDVLLAGARQRNATGSGPAVDEVLAAYEGLTISLGG